MRNFLVNKSREGCNNLQILYRTCAPVRVGVSVKRWRRNKFFSRECELVWQSLKEKRSHRGWEQERVGIFGVGKTFERIFSCHQIASSHQLLLGRSGGRYIELSLTKVGIVQWSPGHQLSHGRQVRRARRCCYGAFHIGYTS